MEISCDVVRDLLPRYCAGAASAGSRALVEEHLAGCEACRNELAALRVELNVGLGAEPAKAAEKKRLARFWKGALLAVLILAALAAALKTSFAIVTVPGGGMAPVAASGDKCLFWKSAYWLCGPKDGDIVFTYLDFTRRLKTVVRVIGVPGDALEIEQGVLYRNGEPVEGESFPEDLSMEKTPVTDGCSFVASDSWPESAGSASASELSLKLLPLEVIGGRLLWVLP